MKKGLKKVVAMFVLAICFGTVVSAQSTNSLSSKQLALRNQVQSFLRTEGFQPTIDDDGDIKFKRQGGTYYIRVSSKDEDPMYISLSKYLSYSDAITRTKIILFIGDNDYKMCKVVPSDKYYIIKSEMFITTSSSFTNIFYRVLNVMDGAEEEVGAL